VIANITKGRKAVGALVYDFGPGRRDEHINPRIVAGTVTGTPLQVARAIDHTARQRPEIKAPIWRVSLSLPDEDGILPDSQWAEIADKFVADMGFASAPWVAVRHGDDHIHLTVSRVDWSGQLLSDRWDYRRAREAADRLEEEHGLVRAADRFRAEGPQVRNNELEASNRRRGPDAAVPPEREELRRIVREVRDASRGLGRDAFESGLTDAGVSFRANEASTGRMNGYSFTLAGWTDGGGHQVWVTASKVARDLKWSALREVIGDTPPSAGAPSPAPETALQNLRQDLASGTTAITPEQAQRAADVLRDGQIARGQAVSGAQPALSSDPARVLYEQWKAKAKGEEIPAQRVPEAAPSAPAWDDRRRRPFGRMSAKDLPKEMTKAEGDVARWTAAVAKEEKAVRGWDAVATGQISGPHVRELHELRARLAPAEPYLAVVDEQMKRAETAQGIVDRARVDWRDANRKKDLGWWQLRKLDTTKGAETKRAETMSEAIHLYIEQERQARAAASAAYKQAQDASGVNAPDREFRSLTQDWDTRLAQAQREDQAHGRGQRALARAHGAEWTGYLDRAQRRLDGLKQEQQLRDGMPEAQRKAEGKARRDAALARMQSPKGNRRGAGRPGPALPREQPSHLRRPPPPSRGTGRGL